ncbi:unnamed protein product, partial [Mesorhabditis spiculigera]
MGCCMSSDERDEELLAEKKRREQSPRGVGMGVAMMMQQAGVLVGASPHPDAPDIPSLLAQIRKAKAEGRTVTLVNGNLYFDYHLVCRIPPHYNLNV